MRLPIFIFCIFLFNTSAYAAPQAITVEQVATYLNGSGKGKLLDQLVRNKLAAQFSTISYPNDSFLLKFSPPIEGLTSNSASLRVSAIYNVSNASLSFKPKNGISVAGSDIRNGLLNLNIEASGAAVVDAGGLLYLQKRIWMNGFRFCWKTGKKWGVTFKYPGTCATQWYTWVPYADTFSVSGDFNYKAKLDFRLALNPLVQKTVNGETQLSFVPVVSLKETIPNLVINKFHAKIGLTYILDKLLPGTPVSDLLSRKIRKGALSDIITEKKKEIKLSIADKRASIQKDLDKKLRNKVFTLPRYSPQMADLILSLVPNLSFPISQAFLQNHWEEILFFAFTGDRAGLEKLLTSSLACQASTNLMVNMPVMPLPAGTPFTATSIADFCGESIDSAKLGNADVWDGGPWVSQENTSINQPWVQSGSETEMPWTLNPATKYNLGVNSITGNYQPYMKRVMYKSVIGAPREWKQLIHIPFVPQPIPAPRVQDTTCKLEMRIYKKDIAATNLKPVIAFHGGSWKYRGAGWNGLESQISHMTERGMVVFAPFYRLAGSSDGPAECHNAKWDDITSDAESAFDWVEANMAQYGAEGKISLMGQSAGAHLSAWLSTNYAPAKVERAFLLYPPTDLGNYVDDLNAGNIDPTAAEQGIDALETFLNIPKGSLNRAKTLAADAVTQNSFPTIVNDQVAAGLQKYPSMFMVHGYKDALVPYTQSTRLCKALDGKLNSTADLFTKPTGKTVAGYYSGSVTCGDNGSSMHLMYASDHGLDFCLPGVKCPTTSEPFDVLTWRDEKNNATNVLNQGFDWLANGDVKPWMVPIISLMLQ